MKSMMHKYLKGWQHGNFHFHPGDYITLKKQGKLLLSLRDLESVYYALAIQSRQEGKDEQYYWRQFNSDIQKLIDDKLAELEPLIVANLSSLLGEKE